jgi:hypothetical protein
MQSQKEALEARFYEAVGRCIKIWAGVESYLFDICVEVLGAPPDVAGVVFFRTPTIDAKLTLVSDLFLTRFLPNGLGSGEHPPKILSDWESIATDLQGRLSARNLAAHSPVSYTHTGEIEKLSGEWVHHYIWQIREHSADASRPKKGKVRRETKRREVDADALFAHVEEIRLIISQMRALLAALRELPAKEARPRLVAKRTKSTK